MSQKIVVEALLRTTAWGVKHRAGQVRRLVGGRRGDGSRRRGELT
jgi:dolichol-phosphate mannosyltransferase